MKYRKRRLSFLFIALYLLGVVVSAFTLFNLKNKLIYDLNVLAVSDIPLIQPVFDQLHIIIGISMILGLMAIYYSFIADNSSVVYVEKEDDIDTERLVGEEESTEGIAKLNTSNFSRFLNAKNALSQENIKRLLSAICKELDACQGAFYLLHSKTEKGKLKLIASFAMSVTEGEEIYYEIGEGLIGQVAKEKRTMYLDDLPEGYIKIFSGLGQASPKYLLIVPVLVDGELIGVIEFSTFKAVSEIDIASLEELMASFGQDTKQLHEQKPEMPAEGALVTSSEKNSKNQPEE